MSELAPVLSVTQAARELNLTERAIRHRIKAGTLEAYKLGDGRTSAYYIPRHAIENALGAGHAA